jgi:hypothetical protein
MACDTFLTMLALPVLYLLFGKGPRVEAAESNEEPDSAEANGSQRPEEVLV